MVNAKQSKRDTRSPGLGVYTVKRNGNHPVSRSTGGKGWTGNPLNGLRVCEIHQPTVAEDK